MGPAGGGPAAAVGQQPQPGGQYGQPGGFGQQPAPKKKSSTLVILIIIVVVLIAVVAFLGFVTPGFFNKKVFDNNAVQEGVSTVLKNDYKLKVSSVTCPADQPVKASTTFTCKATVDGQEKSVTITVKSDDGHYEVGQPQ